MGGSLGAMHDAIADRGEHDDALCAVCGGGHSEAPNCIVFCDRCDLAVHQVCYDLDTVPPGAPPHSSRVSLQNPGTLRLMRPHGASGLL